MFEPPRCPNPDCPQHSRPRGRFYERHGTYQPKCRPWPIPRFVCRTCRRGFSRQTFRADYRDHRPDLNPFLSALLASGLGLRQSARLLGLSNRCTELKFRKIAIHLRHLNLNLRGPLAEGSCFQFDELETYEGRRNTRPLSVPVLIERDSRFIVWAESATIRPRGKMTEARKRAIQHDERRFGKRRDRSRRSVQRTLRKGAALAKDLERVDFESDEKSTYPVLARQAFGSHRLVHRQTNSKLARTTWNPLFPINHTEAMARDLVGRLRRDSWLVSKKAWCLDLGLQIFMTYKNYIRGRFNFDRETPAQRLGFVRGLRWQQVLSWRQDWGRSSIHPLSRCAETIADWRTGAAAA